MKSIEDLNKLIPTLVELIKNNKHEIGESIIENDGYDWGICEESCTNYLTYEEDGWCIQITYECCGEWECDPGDYWTAHSSELIRAWGEVSEISAYHYDEILGEEIEFSDEDVTELWIALDKAIQTI